MLKKNNSMSGYEEYKELVGLCALEDYQKTGDKESLRIAEYCGVMHYVK